MSAKSLEDRVDRIEKIFWAIGAVALIFGVSGAWGLNILQGAKAQIDKATIDIAKLQEDLTPIRTFVAGADKIVSDARLQVEKETKAQLVTIKPAVNDLAQREVKSQFRGRAAFSKKTDSRITSGGRHCTVSLHVKKGDVIHVSYTASARGSEFYYQIVDVDNLAARLTDSVQVIQDSGQLWRSIAAQEVLRADSDRELQLAVEFFKQDLSGRVNVVGSTLVAVIVAADS